MAQSPELAGGAGFTFADQVAARYLAALLVGTAAPGLADRRVSRVALEQRAAGEPLDDIVVDAVAPDKSTARLGLQAKSELTISAATNNEDFRAVIRDCWGTLDKPDFRNGVDRVGAAVGPSTAVGKTRDLVALAEFARSSATPNEFAARFRTGGSASKAHRAIMNDLQRVTSDLGRPAEVADLYRLLRHFVIIRFDALHAGATEDAVTISLLEQALAPGHGNQGFSLFNRVQTLARRGAGTARSWDRSSLRLDIAPWFKLAVDRWLVDSIDRLLAETRSAAASIANRIGDATIGRPTLRRELAVSLSERHLVTLRGAPGSGKSVLLRDEVEAALAHGPALLLKADRLKSGSWAQYGVALGINELDPIPLLSEIAVVGTPTLFIDGLDRIDKTHRGIVTDLLTAIEQSPCLADWRVLATLRDSGVEPVRTWLPQMFDGGRIASIQVDGLEDDEANALAKARPNLRPLLLGPEPVRTLVRRPFFAKILDEAGLHAGSIPRSEVELLARWWARGGYDAEGAEVWLRQRALLRLVRLRALQPDASVSLDALDDSLLPIVQQLVTDGVLEDAGEVHFVRFAHDIFFEWSFAQFLASAGDKWVDELKAAGEPPVVGRSVDLRAQVMFVSDHAAWARTLATLKDPSLRSQWRRAWLLAPLNHSEFPLYAANFEAAVFADDYADLRMALVWFQAQHTVPNPLVLAGSSGVISNRDVRLQAADLLGWPDDLHLWMRFLQFVEDRLENIPHRLLPHVLTLFEVWQNGMADFANPTSETIIVRVGEWLAQLESRHERMSRFRGMDEAAATDPWHAVSDLKDFESSLRRLFLRASRVETTRVATYLEPANRQRRAESKAFDDVMSLAPLLSQTHPGALATFTLNHFRRELPEDHRRRRLEEERRSEAYLEELRQKPPKERDRSDEMSLATPRFGYMGPERWDWDALALENDPHGYSPASPLHQPFHALFEHAPEEALRLVNAMTNHAVEAWRQLHRLQPERGTPVPITVNFPWGEQTFWGSAREYLWSRGLWAPKPLASAYMALDRWALAQVEAGAGIDILIEKIVKGNHSIASLGIALHVALARPAVTPVTEALVSTQRLWGADIERWAQEGSIRLSSQIGFSREEQRKDALAVDALNNHAVRSKEIRSLAILHVLQADETARARVQAAILSFADTPDFEFVEAKLHHELREQADEQDRSFAALGNPAHDRLIGVPDRPDIQAIVVTNPVAEEPSVKARIQDDQSHPQTFALFNWAEKSLKSGNIDDAMSLEQAVAAAKLFDDESLFDTGQNESASMTREAVAGAAAVVVAFAPEGKAGDWARAVLSRASAAREEAGPLWSSVSIVSWHHMIFVARAATADLRRDPANRKCAIELLTALIHPLDRVGLEASNLLATLWKVAPHLSWVGLGLGLDLCILAPDEVGTGSMYDPCSNHIARQRKLDIAIAALDQQPAPLPVPPGPWVSAERTDHRRFRRHRTDDDGEHWRAADGWWESGRAGKILRSQTIADILASGFAGEFLNYCRTMLTWTVERRAPAWAARSRDTDHRPDIYEWTDHFAEVLRMLIGSIDPDSAEAHFLQPICDISDDDACFDLLAPLVRMFLRLHVLDAPVAAPVTSVVLDRALNRMLAASTFSPSAHRAGELHGYSMPALVRWLMFVAVENASLAHRFSNGDWSEIGIILPVVCRFVSIAGWAPSVMANFLTLVERARDHFPAEAFADAILAALSATTDPGARWRGTGIAARIASRVQDMAERAAPLPLALGQKFLRILDILVDQGDRRSAALQIGPVFRDLRIPVNLQGI